MSAGEQPGGPRAHTKHLSIGEVLSFVQQDFPDITISKIRFLESQGLLDPERTPSGYRKFYDADIDRLQWILRQQRDHFLPLKVIRDRLEEWDATGVRPADGARPGDNEIAEGTAEGTADAERDERSGDDARHAAASLAAASAMEITGGSTADADVAGADGADEPEPAREPAPPQDEAPPEPPASPAAHAQAPAAADAPADPRDSAMTAAELADAAGVAEAVVDELVGFSMIDSTRVGPDTYFDEAALRVVQACAPFLEHGIEVRHLRMYKIAAEREAGVFEQLVMPYLKQRNPDARARAVETVEHLAEVGEQLHAALLQDALRRTLG